MQNYHDPHAEIVEVGFATLDSVTIVTTIGSANISVGTSGQMPAPVFERPQSASFSEKKSQSGDYVEQEFEAVFTNSQAEYVGYFRQYLDQDGIVMVRYSNGTVLVAGTDTSPVRCTVEESGSPKTLKLSFNRQSPEFAKILQSLS